MFLCKSFYAFPLCSLLHSRCFRIMSQTPFFLLYFEWLASSYTHQTAPKWEVANDVAASEPHKGMANCNFAICWWGLRFVKKAAGPWLAHLRHSAAPAGGGASIPTHHPHRQIMGERRSCWLWPFMQFTLLSQHLRDFLILLFLTF